MLSNLRKKLSGLMLAMLVLNSWAPLAAQALSTVGPSNPAEGFTIIQGQFAPFDYQIDDYPQMPFQPDGTPSANVVVSVDYGDGEMFEETYPVTTAAEMHNLPFHIKDRTYIAASAHPAFDNRVGFLFNESPYFKAYPQGHYYMNPGVYTLHVQAQVTSDFVTLTGADTELLDISVPVTVLPENEAPDFSIQSLDYDAATDTMRTLIRYEGPEAILMSENAPSPARYNEILSRLKYELSASFSTFNYMQSPATEWNVLSQQAIAGSDFYETIYEVTFEHFEETMGVSVQTHNLFPRLTYGQDGSSGLFSGFFILDRDFTNSSVLDYFYPEHHSNFALNVTGSATAQVNEPTELNVTWSEPALRAANVELNVNWGDSSDPEVSTQPVDAASVVLTHTYTTAGTYTAEVCANDSVVNVCQNIEITAVERTPVEGLNVHFGLASELPYENPFPMTQGESEIFNVFINGIPETATTVTVEASFPGTDVVSDSQTWTAPLTDDETWDSDIDTVTTFARTPAETGPFTYQVCVVVDGSLPTCGEQNVQVWSAYGSLGADSMITTPIYEGEPATLTLDIFNVHPEATELNAQIAWNEFDPFAEYNLDVNARDQVAEFNYIYPSAGTYTINYCVMDSRGVSAGGSTCGVQTVEVRELPMQFAFDQDHITVNEDEPVSIRGLVSHVPSSAAEVDLGIDYNTGEAGTSELMGPDARREIAKTWMTTFAEPGIYQVSACARVDGAEACDEVTVEVLNYDLQVEFIPSEITTITREETPVQVRISNINSTSTSLIYTIDWGTETIAGNLENIAIETNGASEMTLDFSSVFLLEGDGWISQVCVADADGDSPCANLNLIVESDATFEEEPLNLNVTGEELVDQDEAITLNANLSNIGHQATNMHITVDWKDGTVDTIDQALVDPYDISVPLTHTYTTRGVRYVDVCADDGRGTTCTTHRVFTMAPDLYAGILSIDALNGMVNVRMGNEGEYAVPATDGITRITVNGVEVETLVWAEDEFNPDFYLGSRSINDRAFDLDLTNPAVDPTGINTVEVCIDATAVTTDRLRENNCGSAAFVIPSLGMDVTADTLDAVQFESIMIPVTLSNIVEGTDTVNLSADFGTADTNLGATASYDVITTGNNTVNAELPVTFTREGTFNVTICTANDLTTCDTTVVTVEPRLSVELTDGMTFVRNEESQFTTTIRNILEGVNELTYTVRYSLETTDGYLLNGTWSWDGAPETAVNTDVIFTEAGSGTIEFCAQAGEEYRCDTTEITVDSDETFEDDALTVDGYGSSEMVSAGEDFTLFADVANFDHQAASYNYIINWGDGAETSDTTALENPFDRTLSTAHAYANRGTYTVQGCIDDGRGAVCDEVIVVVTGVDLYVDITSIDPATGVVAYTLGNQGEDTSASFDGETQIDFNRDVAQEIIWSADDEEDMMNYLAGGSSTGKTADLNFFELDAAVGDNTVTICIDTQSLSGDVDMTNNCETVHFDLPAMEVSLDATATSINLNETLTITGSVLDIMDGASSVTVSLRQGGESLIEEEWSVEAGEMPLALEYEALTSGTRNLNVCATDGRQFVCDSLEVTVITGDLYAEITDFDAVTGTLTYTLGNQSVAAVSTEGGLTTISLNETVASEVTWSDEDVAAYINPGTSSTKQIDLNLYELGAYAGGSENTITVCVDTNATSQDSDISNNCAEWTFTWPFMSIDSTVSEETVSLGEAVNVEGTVLDILDGTPSVLVSVSENGELISSETVSVTGSETPFSLSVELETLGAHSLSVCAETDTAEACDSVVITVETSDLFAEITSFDSTTGLITYEVGNIGNARPSEENGQNSVEMEGVVFQYNPWEFDTDADSYLNAESSATRTYTFPMSEIDLTPGGEATVTVCADKFSVTDDANTENNCDSLVFTVPSESTPTETPTAPVSGGGFTGGGNSGGNRGSQNDDVELASEDPAFTDVDETSSYFEPVQYLYDQGIVQGYEDQTFRPENITNRAEFMKLIVASVGEEPTLEEYSNCFPDVTTQWYAPYVCYAKTQGWVQGYPDGLFRPEQTVNRVESIKMVVNGFELDMDKRKDMMTVFTDVTDNAWYEVFVEVALNFKLIDEKADRLLRPANGMTRGDLAEILFRALQLK